MRYSVAITGNYEIKLPQWGRCLWQDPSDGNLFLAFASGNAQVSYIYSADSGNSWTEPTELFPVDDFSVHNNFDTFMDRRGHIHCGFRYNDSGCYRFVGKVTGGGWDLASGIGPVGFCVAADSGNLKGFNGSLVVQESPDPATGEDVSYNFPAVKIAAKASGDVVLAYILGFPYQSYPDVETMSSYDSSNFVGLEGGYPIIGVNSSAINGPATSQVVYQTFRIGAYGTIRGLSKNFGGPYTDSAFITNFVAGDIGFAPNMAFGSGYGAFGSDLMTLVCTASGQSMYMSYPNDAFLTDAFVRVTTSYNDDVLTTARPDENPYTNGTDLQTWRNTPHLPDALPFYAYSNKVPITSGIAATGNVYGVGESTNTGSGIPISNFPGGGTNCDFMFNEDLEMILYFQGKDNEGRHCIQRIKGYHDINTPKWIWPSKNHPESGVKFVAPASPEFTGGHNHVLFWGGFKAARHPTEPGDGSNKGEFLVTQGWTPTTPSGGTLVVWNIGESPTVQNPYARPTYHLDYTATSGAAGINVFEGITKLDNFLFASHVGSASRMFDGNLNTYANVRNGYAVEIALDKPREINRIEMLSRTLTRPPEVTISGSFDGSNWTRVLTKPSGKLSDGFNESSPLYKLSTTTETIVDKQNDPTNQPTINFDAFCAKYIRFTFENELGLNGSSRIYDMRFYGPGATEPETIRYSQQHTVPDPHQIVTNYLRKNQARRIESFDKYQQGDVPIGFRTYGDFEWRVVGSGKAVQTRSSPNAPLPEGYDGRVPQDSGVWGYYRSKRGYKDGFSLRSEAIGDASGLGSPIGSVPVGGIQPGHSGVVEVDLFLTNDDVDLSNSSLTRDISFRIRTDTQQDDRVEFWTLSPNPSNSSGQRIPTLRRTWQEANTWDSSEIKETTPSDYPEITYKLDNVYGLHTLRWVYYKGAYDSEVQQTNSPNFGAAWIDMVSGLDATPSNYVKGYMRGEAGFESGIVNGYLNSTQYHVINGYMSGSPLFDQINGFLVSSVFADATSQINAYMYPTNESSINGYMTAGDGLASIPTGSIYGFLMAPASGGIESIHGYLEGDWGQNIHGYLRGFGDATTFASGDAKINAYLYSIDAISAINGIVGSESTVVNPSIHGYLNARYGMGDQVIHGYLSAPTGGNAIINGYLPGWSGSPGFFRAPQSMVYGFLQAPVDSGLEQINGYLIANYPASSILGYMGSEALVASGGGTVGYNSSSTSNVTQGMNLIHGYIKGFGGDQEIHGYLYGVPGGTGSINGYMLSGAQTNSINGYVISHETASGIIYGFASGVGFSYSPIHGYMTAVSGSENQTIYSVMTGHEDASELIFGHLIGIPGVIGTSSEICESHSFPLVTVPVVTIPSGNFF